MNTIFRDFACSVAIGRRYISTEQIFEQSNFIKADLYQFPLIHSKAHVFQLNIFLG